MNREHRQRGGTILICVLTCLLIVSALAVAMVKSALTARKAVRSELQHAQAQFLLEAGIQRAVDKLSLDSEYQGETWDLPAEVLNPPPQSAGEGLGERDSATPSNRSILARIEIQITTPDERSPRVTIVAQLPADSPLSIRRSHTFTFSNEE
jgi:hypothetical protein